MKENVSLPVEKATYDLAMGLGNFAVELVATLGDGFQPVRDAVAIGAAVISDIVPVASNFAQLPADLKEDPGAFIAAWLKVGLEIYPKLVKK